MITIKNRKTGETIQIDETNPKLLAKYGIKIPKANTGAMVGGDIGGLLGNEGNSFMGTNGNIDKLLAQYQQTPEMVDLFSQNKQLPNSQLQTPTSADSPINFPNILSNNQYVQRIGQGVKAIADGTNNGNDAQAAAGVVKTALATGAGVSNFFGDINQRKIAFGQENNNTFNQIDGLFTQPYLASNVNQGSNNNPATYAEGGFKQTSNMLNSGISKFTGKKHYEGGIPINTDQPFTQANDLKINRDGANLEVENEEYYVPMAENGGAFVASDVNKLGRGGKSPAKLIELRTKEETGVSANKLTTKLSKREKFINDNKSYLSNPLLNSTSDSMSLLSVPLIEQHKIIAKEEVFAQEKKKRDMGKPNDFASLKYGGGISKAKDGEFSANFSGIGSKQSSTVQNPYFDPADVSAFKETLYYGDKFAPRAEQIKLGLAKGFNANPNIGNTQGAMTSLLNLGINPVGKSTKELQKELFDMDYKNNNNEVLREVYNTYLNTEQGNKAFGNKEWEELTTEQRRQFFEDDINGVRTAYMQKRLQPQTQVTFKPKEERPSDPITPNNYPTNVAEGDKKGKRSNTLIPRMGNTYPIEPIQKLSLTPYDYTPNLINPQAQINEITRGNYIGNTTTDRSKKAQEFTNDYAAIQNIMGSVTNQNTQLKNQASQINNTNRQNINQLNLGYGQTFMDNIAQRNAVVTQQQMMDNNAYTKALTDQNHEASTIEYLKTAYPTEFAAMMANQPVSRLGKAKYGGKIKLKPKKKK